MPLATNALVTLAEAKEYLRIATSESDAKLENAINRASGLIEAYCNRPLKEATYTDIRLPGICGPKFYLPATPINIAQTLTVTVNELTQTVWKQESDGDPSTFDVIVSGDNPHALLGQRNHLWRSCGWASSKMHPYNVKLTYTGGLATVPADLKEAALLIVQKFFRDMDKQLADVATITLPSGNVQMYDTVFPRRALALLTPYVVPL